MSTTDGMTGMHSMTGMTSTSDTGMTASSGGFALNLATRTVKPRVQSAITFVINGPDGMPVTSYVVDQTKKLHLYLIRRDLSGFQHIHPTLAGDGTWRVQTSFPDPGTYRLVADFTVKVNGVDTTHVLGAPLTVSGSWTPQATPAPVSRVTVDGYTVEASGRLTAGTASPLTIRITRDGMPVTDLQPYLGVWAHLSAFHASNLAFAHLHPTQEPMSGKSMASPDALQFHAELPTAGLYRVYVQFQTGGTVHTAALTLRAM
jgi:hypothetical protein